MWKNCDIDRRGTAGFRKIDCRMKVAVEINLCD